ncbi:MAG: hypothetical protein ABIQ10_05915 [Gemmatimonadaceae bacterium]
MNDPVTSPTSNYREPVAPPRRRKRWLAALFSVLTPGLGHLYLKEPRRALSVWALAVVGNLAGLLLAMRLDGNAQLLVLALVALASSIAQRSSRRQPSSTSLAILRCIERAGRASVPLFTDVVVPRNSACIFAPPSASSLSLGARPLEIHPHRIMPCPRRP